MNREPLPAGWHRLPKPFSDYVIALRSSYEKGSPHKEYHAELYHDEAREVIEAYVFNSTHLGISLTLNEGESLWELHIGLPYWTFGLRGGSLSTSLRSSEYGLRYRGGRLILCLGQPPHAWSRNDPWWWEMRLNLKQLIFGKTKYEEEETGVSRGFIKLPEGVYAATVSFTNQYWWSDRPILGRFKTRFLRSAGVTSDIGIPIPGKGEDSWNCADAGWPEHKSFVPWGSMH
jgi:hypothetical protein